MKKVFITGATGFVGGHLKNHLTARGYEVSSPTRNDLGDPFSVDAWRKALEKAECETVVHLIAKTHATDAGDPSALSSYRLINVDITKALLEASKDLCVKKFIYLSSIKAVGEETPIDEPFTEESPCRPEDCYGISKREAEELVLEYSRTINTVILRPPLIYGPGVKGNFFKLMKAVKKGIPLPFASVRNARSLLFVGNLSDAIENIVESLIAGGSLFHIADAEATSTPELLKLMSSALNVKSRVLPFSVPLLEALAFIAGKQDTIKKLTRSLIVSSSKASQTLYWKPFYSLQVGINQSLKEPLKKSRANCPATL
jgi:UDP-glucose 4-epimerase